MKLINATTKSKADKMIIDSLFKAGGTLNKLKYDCGKYKNPLTIGQAVEVSDDIMAIWTEQRSDKDGKYFQIYCLTKAI